MKQILILVLFFFIAFRLDAQKKESDKLYKEALRYYDKKDYIKAKSTFELALTYYPASKIYERLTEINKALGDTCEYCINLGCAKSGNEKLKKEYADNCVDTIRFKDSLNVYKLYCARSKFCNNKGQYQDFYMKCKDTIMYSFTIIDSNYRICMKEYNSFPNIDNSLNSILFYKTDVLPKYIGGENKLYEFLGENIKYPREAKEENIQGTVYLSFIVDEKGNVENVKILKGVHKTLDDESLRLVSLIKKWEPGKYKGIQVKVKCNIPIKYTLN